MKKKAIKIGQKLFLQKETVIQLSKTQQAPVLGGVNTREPVAACLTHTISTIRHPATCQE